MLQSTASFFSNDLVGVLKAVGMAGTIIAAVVSAIWAIMKGDLKAQINGVGGRVDNVEKTQTELKAESAEHRRRIDAHDTDMRHLDRRFSEVLADVGAVKDENRQSRRDILAAIHEQTSGLAGSVRDLEKQVSILIDRDDRRVRESET